MRSSAHALVTWVKARLRHSRFPNEPELSILARSASVDLDGNVSFLGPPFCCWNNVKSIENSGQMVQCQVYRVFWTDGTMSSLKSILDKWNNVKSTGYSEQMEQCQVYRVFWTDGTMLSLQGILDRWNNVKSTGYSGHMEQC